jgi:hypothetical protein
LIVALDYKTLILNIDSVLVTSPLYNACGNNNINLVEQYLQTMSLEEVNQIEPNGSTALHVAAYRGHEEIAELLLRKGASHSIRDKYDCTPLDEAKTDKIKQMIRRQMNKTRFVSDFVEWVIATNDADFQAHQYWTKLEAFVRGAQLYQLIVYMKQNYLETALKDIDDIKTIKQYFDMAINEDDPFYLLKAYAIGTNFYSTLNAHLAQLNLQNLTNHENLSQVCYIEILAQHPKLETLSYTGIVFRGMRITKDDLEQHKIGTRILTKTFSSTSKQINTALTLLANNRDIDDRLSTICQYEIRNRRTALDIQHISVFEDQQEVLILPYTVFKIIDIKFNKDSSPRVEIKLKECEPW